MNMFRSLIALLLVCFAGQLHAQTWNKTSGGPYNWLDAANWNGSVPNSITAVANMNIDITADIVVNLTGNIQLDQFTLGDSSGTSGYLIQPNGGSFSLQFNNTNASQSLLRKNGSGTDTIAAQVIVNDNMNLDVAGGTLILSGGLIMNGNAVNTGPETVVKNGGSTLTVSGDTFLGAGSDFQVANGTANINGNYNQFQGQTIVTGGTALNVGGAYNIYSNAGGPSANAISVSAGTMNIGNTTGTTRTAIASTIRQLGGTLNLGRDGGISNVAFYGGLTQKGNGTLRLQNGNAAGTTTVLGGSAVTANAATLTAGSATFTSSGVAGGPLYVGMRVYGPGIADNTFITAYNSGTGQVTLNNPVAAGFTQSNVQLMFGQGVGTGLSVSSSTGLPSTTVNVSSSANLNVGDTITGAGIPKGVRIAEILSPTSVRLETNVVVSATTPLQTYRPATLTFGGISSLGTAGSVVDFLRGAAAGTAAGQVAFDPSLNLVLQNRAFVNISDNAGTIQDFTFNSLNSNANTTNNTFTGVATTAGSPFVFFATGQTGLVAGTYITGPGIPAGARVISVNGNTALLDIAATATNNNVSLNVMQYTTIRSEAGGATLTVGNYGAVNDVFDGRLDFGGSGATSRLIKVGSNTMTLSGAQDNSSARVEVQEGTVVLAKDSNAYVHAVGSQLTIGDADTAFETVRIGGSFDLPSIGFDRYNDQIARGATVTINATGFLDLNGFTEGFGVLNDTDNIGGIIGNSNALAATLIIGEASDTSATFRGVIRDGSPTSAGGGVVNFVKSGGGTQTMLGANTYTGTTAVTRGNVTLSGANGALTGTSSARVTNATLFLNNSAASGGANNNRINDNAQIILRNGTFTVTQNNTLATNITESVGAFVLQGGHNVLRTQHDQNIANTVRINLASYSWQNGSMVSIVENNDDGGAGRGFSGSYNSSNGFVNYLSPDQAKSQVTVSALPTAFLVGGGGVTGTADINILLGAFGGHHANHTREFMTVQTVGGVNYIRPLQLSEYTRITAAQDVNATNSAASMNDVARHDFNNARFNENLAYNSLRYHGGTRTIIRDDKVLKIGDGNSAIGYNPAGHVGAGMLILQDWAASIYGGNLDFGSREAVIRGNGSTLIQTSIVGNNATHGLIKSGGGNLDLWGNNNYTGQTYVTQGGLRAFNSNALGLGGAANYIRIVTSGNGEGDTLTLGNGVIIGSLTNPNLRKDVIIEYDGRLSAWDQNNVLNGDIRVASGTAGGQNITSYIRTRRNSAMLTINGDVVNDQSEVPISATFNDGSGRVVSFIGDQMNDGIITVNGSLADRKIGGVTSVANYDYERLNIMVRGSSGDAGRSAPIMDFHVNVEDASNLTGSLDLRSGFFRLQGNYGTGVLTNPTAQGGVVNMTMRLRDNDNDFVNQVAVFSMTNNNANPLTTPTVYNVNNIAWADGNNGYSATSYGMLANEGVGKVVIGNGYGSLDMNPTQDISYGGTFSFNYANPPVLPGNPGEPDPTPNPALPNQNGTVINFGLGGSFDEGSMFSNLAVGMLIEGAGIPAGTFITAIGANSITVSQAVAITQNTNISFSSLQTIDLTGATQGVAANVLTLNGAFPPGFDINNLRPGMVLTGTGIQNSTYILRIDPVNNQIVLNKTVTGNPTNIVFNDMIPGSTATQRYADARLYANTGGELDLRLRLLDDGGFGLENEVGAVTKVGRGDARLSGAIGLSGELDGGLNLHGGKLILDYSQNPGRKVTSGDNQEAPLTLAGGDLHLVGNATANAVEQIRGLVIMRPGDSQIRVSSAGTSTTTLSLGPPSNLLNNVTMLPVRYAGSTMSFWRDLAAGGSAVITFEVPDIYTGSAILPWATYVDGDPLSATYGKVVDFAYVTSANSPTDALGIAGAAEEGLFTIGNNLNFVNDSIANPTVFYPWRYGYLAEGQEEPFFPGSGSGFYGTIAPETGMTEIDLRAILFNVDNDNQNGQEFIDGLRADPNNVMKIATGSTMVLRTEGNAAAGAAGTLGGAILISATVGDTHKTIQGGAISSELVTYYFDPDITKKLVKTNDLIVHNHADAPNFANPSSGGGIFTLDTNIVNNPYDSTTRLNFVHSGTGWTRMLRATATGPGYSYTGSTFFNGGTIWVSDPNKLGAKPVGVDFDSDNFYFTGGRLRIADMTELNGTTVISSAASNITLDAFRGITIGGDGAYIDVAKASTTFTINNLIAVEVHAPTFSAGIIRKSNLGVGDLTKEGLGTLVIGNKGNTYSGRTDVKAGTLQVNIGDPIANQANSNPVATRAADNEEANLAGTLGSSFSYIDGTFVDAGAQLRFNITGNTTANAIGKIFQNGTGEWITLDGGTLGTTAAHTGGSLQGMIRVRKNSVVDIFGSGILRFNSEAGMMTSEGATAGQGALTKTGTGTLELWENNTEFTGNWNVQAGRIVGISQGTPFGTGTTMTIGDAVSAAPSAAAEVFLSSRQTRTVMIEEVAASSTAAGNQINVLKGDTSGLFPGMAITINGTTYRIAQVINSTAFNVTPNFPASTVITGPITIIHTAELPLNYNVAQNIVVNAEAAGASQQTKKIGARNHATLANSGMNWDRYNYDGSVTLNDDLIVSYYDDVNNASIAHNIAGQTTTPLIGRDQVIALNGNISATNGNDLITEILYNGDAAEQALNKRLRIYFEINGANNSAWASDLVMGNGEAANADLDKTHFVRLGGTGTPITAATDVQMSSNSVFQVGGKNVTIGNLMVNVTGVAEGGGAIAGRQQIVVENASDAGEGTLRVTQRDHEDWDVEFRDGVTDPHYITNVNNITDALRNRKLNIIKDGSATAVLTQDNDHTGTTQVDLGRLQVGRGGSAATRSVGDTGLGGAGQGGMIVNSNGRIGGTGTIQGLSNTTNHILRGVIEPGDYTGGTTNGIGTLAVVGNLTSQGGSFSFQAGLGGASFTDGSAGGLTMYRDFTAAGVATSYKNYVNSVVGLNGGVTGWDSNASSTARGNHDFLSIQGALTLDNASKVVFTGTGITFAAGQVFDLMDWTNASAGLVLNYGSMANFDGVYLYQGGNHGSFELPDLSTISSTLLWDLSKFESHGILMITTGLAVVPEPGRLMLLGLALSALMMRRRRNRSVA